MTELTQPESENTGPSTGGPSTGPSQGAASKAGPTKVGYGQYCPISRALEVLGERWSLMILRDLVTGTSRFNDLARGLPGLSRTLLAKRLRELERAGLLDHLQGRYLLTPAGEQLEPIIFGLAEWGARFTFGDPHERELDPDLLVWWMHSRLDTTGLPGRWHVLHVRFTDHLGEYWIVLDGGEPSICRTPPRFEVNLTLRAELATLYQVWLGALPLRRALREGTLIVEGQPAWTRRLAAILQLSPAASAVIAASG